MVTPVILPRFGMTMEEGTIVQWLRREGDAVEKGEPIAEVATDKVNMEVEAPASGILRGICAQPGETVPIACVIAYIASPGEDLPGGPPRPAAPSAGPAAPHPAAASASPPRGFTPPGPPMSPAAGEVSGVSGRGVSPEGEARREGSGAGPATIAATPVARRLAREAGLDLTTIAGTGPGGRITESDVRAAATTARTTPALAAEAPAGPPRDAPGPAVTPAPAAAAGSSPSVAPAATSAASPVPMASRLPLSHRRRIIAQRMAHSVREIPHVYLSREADMSAAAAARGAASYTAVMVWAAARALQAHPLMRASWDSDAVAIHDAIHIGVAVDAPEGLIVPVVHDADRKDLAHIHGEIEALVRRALDGTLTLDDIAGATFTISNLGMLGVDAFTALINPPQSAVLAAGAIRRRPWVEGEALVVRPVCTLTLAVDHRVADGAAGARYLDDLCRLLQTLPG